MDFELNEDQRAFADTAQQFADERLAPMAAEWDEKQIFPKDVLREAGELGFLSLYTPEAQGGLGLSRLDASIIFEQLAMGCTSTTAFMTIHNMVSWMIASFATDEAKTQFCPKLVTGEWLGSYCLTEPNAGSDAAALTTSATKKGDKYVINGGKTFISGAGETDVLVVMARTGEAGAKGVSAFVVPAQTGGISYGRKEPKMGWNSQPTRAVTFENVAIPASHLLGEEGQGFVFAMKGLDGGRINIATCSVGTAPISVLPQGAPAEEFQAVDRIKLVKPNDQSLFKDTNGLFRHKTPNQPYEADATVSLQTGAIEGSNVNAVGEMTALIDLQRQFEMQVKMMSTAEEMDKSSDSLLRMS